MDDELLKQLRHCFPDFASKLQSRADACIENIQPPATAEDLVAAEEDLGIRLPESYKRFLRCSRGFWLFGGAIQFGTQHPFFHAFAPFEQLTKQQQDSVRNNSGGRWPPPSDGMLCFAEFFMEADGDQILFDVADGMPDGEYPVMYYAHESRPPSVRKLTNDFSAFLNEFLDYEQWQYDGDE